MKALSKAVTVILLIFCLFTAPSTAAIKSIKIRSDNRPLIILEEFGFTHTGFISVAISNVAVTSAGSLYDPSLIGFFLLRDRPAKQLRLELEQYPGHCIVNPMFDSPLFTLRDISEPHSSLHRSYNVTYPGGYSLIVANCNPQSFVTMEVRIELYNIYNGTTKDYLSVGLTQLPSIYFVFSLIYMCFFAIWIRVCYKNQRSVRRIHLLMGALLTTQALSMFCDAEDRHHVKVTGTSHGWNVMFHMFHSINNVLFFTVIVLVSAGWSYLKPFLQKGEKMFLMMIITIRVLNSIVVDETGLLSEDWVAWNEVSFWIDILCCIHGFLFPIMWSKNSLKEASKTDEKSGRNLSLFRQFYWLVMGYISLTIICVLPLKTSNVDYKNRWAWSATEEIGTLVFCLVMFYMFRPVEEDEYQVYKRCI